MHRHRSRLGRWAVAFGTAGLVVVGCGDEAPDDPSDQEANPASEFCVEQGGEVDIVDEADGQVGYCVMPDGSRVEEWEYFREHGPEIADE